MEETSGRLPPIHNPGHAFSTPVLANMQPHPFEGGPPRGYQNVDHDRHHAELLNSRAPPGLRGTRSQARLQHMRTHQICTPNLSCVLCSANAAVGSWQQYTTAVFIEDDVLIGGNVAVVPGCHIGKGAAVEAGSVVTNVSDPTLQYVRATEQELTNIHAPGCSSYGMLHNTNIVSHVMRRELTRWIGWKQCRKLSSDRGEKGAQHNAGKKLHLRGHLKRRPSDFSPNKMLFKDSVALFASASGLIQRGITVNIDGSLTLPGEPAPPDTTVEKDWDPQHLPPGL